MKNKKSFFKKLLFVILFIVLLPIILLEAVIKRIVFKIKRKRFLSFGYGVKEFLENASIEKIDIMEGFEFEKFLKIMYLYQGYEVKETARTGDYGADLILYKNKTKTVLQAKRYNGNVGSKALQEIYAAKAHYVADEMIVVTNSYFTKQAELTAAELGIILIDRNDLEAEINKTKEIIKDTLHTNIMVDESLRDYDNFKYRI